MKTNIVLVGLIDNKTRSFASKLAEDFDLYFADVNEIIDYKLFNSNDIEEKCGKDYLEKLKKNIIKEISSFENTLIYVPHSFFIDEQNRKFFKSYGTVVFLDFSKQILTKQIEMTNDNIKKQFLKVEELVFEERGEFFKKSSEIVVPLLTDAFDKNYKQIKKVIEKYLL